jgi:hypothetical protein
MIYEYLTVPFEGMVENFSSIQVADQLTSLINQVCEDGGWEFYMLNSVNITVAPGCIASLFGAQSFSKKHDMLVFRRAKIGSGLPKEPLIARDASREAATRTTPQAPDGADAVCPNDACGAPVRSEDLSCWKCRAIFSDPQGWKPLRRS